MQNFFEHYITERVFLSVKDHLFHLVNIIYYSIFMNVAETIKTLPNDIHLIKYSKKLLVADLLNKDHLVCYLAWKNSSSADVNEHLKDFADGKFRCGSNDGNFLR